MDDDPNTRPWNAFENRCDRCGSESWVRLQRIVPVNEVESNVQEMFWCGHHGRRFGPLMEAEGWDGDDYSSQINPEPSLSANV